MRLALIAIAVLASLIAQPSFAAKRTRSAASLEAVTTTDSAVIQAEAPAAKGAMEVMAYYSMASELNLDYKIRDVGVSETNAGAGAVGVGARYINVRNGSVGGVFGINYEFARSFNTLSARAGSSSTTGAYAQRPDLSLFVFDGGLTYGLNEKTYLIGGLNYCLPMDSGFGRDAALPWLPGRDLTPGLGVQAGAGIRVEQNLHLEAIYRTINMGVTGPDISGDKARLWGMALRGAYRFQ